MMKSCSEMRGEAWKQVVCTKWMWRLAVALMLLNAVAHFVLKLISDAYVEMGITTCAEFAKSKFVAAQQGLDYTVPSSTVLWQMIGASAFETFIAYIFGAILALGLALVTLKAVRSDEEKWLVGAFEGFRRPLESAWLLFLINLRVFLWSLLFVVPGVVAAYRYRQAWYIKAQHPEFTASQCIKRSTEMMVGWKWKAFVFDFSYVGWLLLAGLVVGAGLVVANALANALSMVFAVFIVCYFLSGRAVFYRELCTEKALGDE
jgi:hypothetical protein